MSINNIYIYVVLLNLIEFNQCERYEEMSWNECYQ